MGLRIKINTKKLDAIVRAARSLDTNVIDKDTAHDVGQQVTDKMNSLISKGISPIKGNGRFPGYKNIGAADEKARANKVNSANYKGKQGKEFAKRYNDAIVAASRKGVYPFSVQDKYPDKKPRPVNLFLSGAFLDALTHSVDSFKHGYNTTIYYKGDEDKKESGHREGVHGQPSRPTIPVKGEEFVVAIQRIVSKIFKERINQLLKIAGLKS